MKELELHLKQSLKFDSEESLYFAIKAFKELSDITQPQYIRRAAFLGYTTLVNILKHQQHAQEQENVNKN